MSTVIKWIYDDDDDDVTGWKSEMPRSCRMNTRNWLRGFVKQTLHVRLTLLWLIQVNFILFLLDKLSTRARRTILYYKNNVQFCGMTKRKLLTTSWEHALLKCRVDSIFGSFLLEQEKLSKVQSVSFIWFTRTTKRLIWLSVTFGAAHWVIVIRS